MSIVVFGGDCLGNIEKNLYSIGVTDLLHITGRKPFTKSKNLVDKQASIMEICFNMITEGRTRLYVVENDKYFGMIERRDIIKKFLHI